MKSKTRYVVVIKSDHGAVVDTYYPTFSNWIDILSVNVLAYCHCHHTMDETRRAAETKQLYDICDKANKENTTTKQEVDDLLCDLNTVTLKLKKMFPKLTSVKLI